MIQSERMEAHANTHTHIYLVCLLLGAGWEQRTESLKQTHKHKFRGNSINPVVQQHSRFCPLPPPLGAKRGCVSACLYMRGRGGERLRFNTSRGSQLSYIIRICCHLHRSFFNLLFGFLLTTFKDYFKGGECHAPSLNEALLEVSLTIPPLLHCVCMCAHVCVSVNTGGGVSMESE